MKNNNEDTKAKIQKLNVTVTFKSQTDEERRRNCEKVISHLINAKLKKQCYDEKCS